MNRWNEIYYHFDPIAFEVFGYPIHWYGIAYAFALFIVLYLAKYFLKKDCKYFNIDNTTLDYYFIWAEVGIILGARIGYILIYDPLRLEYLTHPWQIFNPFDVNGEFVGIRGMSYHGGVIGFFVATYLFAIYRKKDFFMLTDLIALSVPLGYIFGRIGNFLNQELFGRVVQNDAFSRSIGILIQGELRYPSQLIEAFLEGFVVFIVVFFVYKKIKIKGILIAVYGIAYSVARFISEYFREPDEQMGTYIFGLSMGQILSLLMILSAILLLCFAIKKNQSRL